MQGTLRISFPCPIVVMGGSNLPEGQELVGLFAYRLVSGHWRVQMGLARIGEEGTVTTAGVFGLNVVTGWDKRRPEWVDVACLAMRVRVGRQQKMGGADVIDVEGEDDPPPSARKRKGRPPPMGHRPAPPPRKPCVRPPRWSGRSRRQSKGRGGWCTSGWSSCCCCCGRGGGGWEARAISADTTNRDLEARLSRANEDRRAAKSRLADVTKERDRLAARVKTLQRDLGTAHKAAGAPAKPLARTGEGAEGAEAPPGDRAGGGGGGGSAAGVRYLLVLQQAWHAQAEACAG